MATASGCGTSICEISVDEALKQILRCRALKRGGCLYDKVSDDEYSILINGTLYSFNGDEFQSVSSALENSGIRMEQENEVSETVDKLFEGALRLSDGVEDLDSTPSLASRGIKPVTVNSTPEDLFAMFTMINADCSKTGESVVPLTDVEYYAQQIANMGEGEFGYGSAVRMANAMADYAVSIGSARQNRRIKTDNKFGQVAKTPKTSTRLKGRW